VSASLEMLKAIHGHGHGGDLDGINEGKFISYDLA
jgi:hypothetical protein